MLESMKVKKKQRDDDKARLEASRKEWLQTPIGKEYSDYVRTEDADRRKRHIATYGDNSVGSFDGGSGGFGGGDSGCGGGDGGGGGCD